MRLTSFPIKYYPKSNFNGPDCGYESGGNTKCKQSTTVSSNPVPDGTTSIPDVVSVGRPGTCAASNNPGGAPAMDVTATMLSAMALVCALVVF